MFSGWNNNVKTNGTIKVILISSDVIIGRYLPSTNTSYSVTCFSTYTVPWNPVKRSCVKRIQITFRKKKKKMIITKKMRMSRIWRKVGCIILLAHELDRVTSTCFSVYVYCVINVFRSHRIRCQAEQSVDEKFNRNIPQNPHSIVSCDSWRGRAQRIYYCTNTQVKLNEIELNTITICQLVRCIVVTKS